MNNVIELYNVRRYYIVGDFCVKALDGITLSLPRGSFTAIMGPSGSGKSTLMNIIGCLDTPTSGIVLAARNKETYFELMALQDNDLIIKTYIADVSPGRKNIEGFENFPYSLEAGRMEIVSSFRGYGPKGASVRPVLSKRKGDEKLYKTKVQFASENRAICRITRGFRHQIRCHLCWSGHPIIGDERYGGEENDLLLLEAVSVLFPYKGKELEISI